MDWSLANAFNPARVAFAAARGVLPSLIDERFDHDSCGVGFVAAVDGASDHEILKQALIQYLVENF